MANTPNLKKLYQDEVAPALMQKFGYKSVSYTHLDVYKRQGHSL